MTHTYNTKQIRMKQQQHAAHNTHCFRQIYYHTSNVKRLSSSCDSDYLIIMRDKICKLHLMCT